MKHIPWKSVAMSCGTLAVLVLFRSVITAGRFLYYGGVYWQDEIMEDPWFYVGMVAAAFCVAALLVLSDQSKKETTSEENALGDDGCEE